MDIESTMDKILNPIERHSQALGALAATLVDYQYGTVLADLNALVAGQVHMPEWGNIASWIFKDPNEMPAIILTILGWLGKDATNNRTLKALGEMAYKGGKAFAITNFAWAALYLSTHSPLIGNTQGDNPQNVQYSVSQGSTLGSGTGGQRLAPYQSVYPTNPTAGNLYTATSGQRLIGN